MKCRKIEQSQVAATESRSSNAERRFAVISCEKVAICLLIVLSTTTIMASDGFHLGAWIQNQSPDGMTVQVNGGIYHETGEIVGWWYDWGDGIVSTGYFPIIHKYTQAGNYQIVVTGYSDQGDMKQITISHGVPRHRIGKIKFIRLSHRYIGLSHNEEANIDISTYDSSGQLVSFTGRTVEIFNSNPDEVYAEILAERLVVRSVLQDNHSSAMATISIYIDGVESNDSLYVIVNNNQADYELISTNYTVHYLPTSYFSSICISDYKKILDFAYLLQNKSIRLPESELGIYCQGISYQPTFYGASGHPLSIGDSAFPTDGIPPYGVLLHEMGHNFSSILTTFNCFAVPGAFYQETIAEWEKQYVFKQILSEYTQEIGPKASQTIEKLAQESADYHQSEYEAYIQRGLAFNYIETDGGSHPLVQKIYEYSEKHGWERIKDFMDCFQYYHIPSLAELISNHGGIEPIENRVTIMAGALQIAFPEEAIAEDFLGLNFPMNDTLFSDFILAFDELSTIQ